jgi:thioredoxin-dependent peroxiredoxin
MLIEGTKAPVDLGKDQHGKNVKLTDFVGKKIVVYFYPKDDTPGCTTQACNLRDHESALLKEGIQVIGISADDAAKHLKFEKKYELNFPLIADVDRVTIDAFGVWGPKKFMGKEYDGIHRTTFLIDESGTIVSVIKKPKTKEHAEEILAIFKNL